MNQGQFTALIEQLQLLNQQLAEVLAIVRPPNVWAFDEPAAETPQGAGSDPSCRTDPDPAPVDELQAAPRKFKKAKGGG